MQVKMADLPGIGKKLSFLTAEGKMLVLIIHHSGKRELYFFEDPDGDEADYSLELTANETRELGAQFLGATYQPIDADTMKMFKNKLVMEWVELAPQSPVANQTIKEARIRTKTGASIMAIVRGDEVIVSPEVDEVLKPGDTLMAAGKSDQISSFKALCRGEEV
ncbi:TrkA domain protein [Caldalkalibacillus uzonensis]|uniref:TrkA domain protein n=1 Tax=Caldalkalibacillus uzonensis TaxID=353224 RepID=A0ABU0CTP6_9BACI|nr:cation:proton antiporter regulatory subunit [Caldalkalibacillus uzonensis]MDQ0339259.1 TrkA domain protein [Caldalkalibacillus uzonensis]